MYGAHYQNYRGWKIWLRRELSASLSSSLNELSASLNCLPSSLNGLSACLLPHPLHKIARAGFALAAVHTWHVGELATEGDEGVGF